MTNIRVGVVETHEVFRRGVLTCLGDEPDLVVIDLTDGRLDREIDVVVMSSDARPRVQRACPMVVCYSQPSDAQRFLGLDNAFALLPRRTVTPEQLALAVRAAAAGMKINSDLLDAPREISDRSRDVLRMLAVGAGTREISGKLGYSERTIKSVISDVQIALGTRNRTHAVAEAVRTHLI